MNSKKLKIWICYSLNWLRELYMQLYRYTYLRLLYLSDYTYILYYYVHVQYLTTLVELGIFHVVDCVITERLCV